MRGVLGTLAAFLVSAGALCAPGVHAQQTAVTFAGVAFSGDSQSSDARFRYAKAYEAQLQSSGDSGYKRLKALLQQAPAGHLDVRFEPIAELKGRDQAVVSAMVLTSETVSTERFGEVRKVFIQERAQALFFDFKSMTVLRSYPFSFAYIDNLRHDPSPQEIGERVRALFEGANGRPGLYARYAQALASASLPQQAPRFLQVTKVTFPPDMVDALPTWLKSDHTVYETWAADQLAEAISSRIGVPVVPYAKGYAVGGVMSMQVSDGDVWNLKLPSPDYEISVNFRGLKKVKYGENGAGASWVYGVLSDVHIEQPLMNTAYLDTPLKNAELKLVPAGQTYVDDFPAYDDTLRGMFDKLADAVVTGDTKWARSAAGAPDIEAQLTKTKDLMNLCK